MLGSPAVRLGGVTALSLAAVWTLRATGEAGPPDAAALGQMLEVGAQKTLIEPWT